MRAAADYIEEVAARVGTPDCLYIRRPQASGRGARRTKKGGAKQQRVKQDRVKQGRVKSRRGRRLDLVAVDQHDVLLVRRPRAGRDEIAEPLLARFAPSGLLVRPDG